MNFIANYYFFLTEKKLAKTKYILVWFYRTDDDEDYLNYPVEYIDRMGLANKKRKHRPAKRTHYRRRHQKREAEASAEADAQEFGDYIGEYNDHDLSTIPAEHRSSPVERAGRNPM